MLPVLTCLSLCHYKHYRISVGAQLRMTQNTREGATWKREDFKREWGREADVY